MYGYFRVSIEDGKEIDLKGATDIDTKNAGNTEIISAKKEQVFD